MSAHNARYDMADQDVVRRSTVSASTMDGQDEFGANVLIVSGGAETRKMPAPDKAGLMMVLTAGTLGGTVTVTAPAGQTFDGGTADEITIAVAGEWIILLSMQFGSTVEWRVVNKHANVEVA